MKQALKAAAALMIAGSVSAYAEEASPTVSYQALSPEMALVAAQATLEFCREEGYQIAVAVVDRFGQTQVVLRDRYAGVHTVDTATRKAWTATTFKTNTDELAEVASAEGEMWALRTISNALPLGGGIYIESGDGALLGGIGVSGAPGGSIDHDCAMAGVEAVEDEILF